LPNAVFQVRARETFLGRIVLLGTTALASLACSTDKDKLPCPAPTPAFHLQITAGGEALPANTRVAVAYGGNLKESYVLAQDSQNVDVCCRPSDPIVGDLPSVRCAISQPLVLDDGGDEAKHDGGDAATGAAPVTGILCSLWTNGPATVTVNATGYVTIDQTLNSRLQQDSQCGVETVDSRLVLGRPEGGT
jgi:hypothetical protein